MVFHPAASLMRTGHVTPGTRRRKRRREVESGERFMQGQKVTDVHLKGHKERGDGVVTERVLPVNGL